MKSDEMKMIISVTAKGDTSTFEKLIAKPGGRKFLETTVLVLLSQLSSSNVEKEEHFQSFITIIKHLEAKINRCKRGEAILKEVFEIAG